MRDTRETRLTRSPRVPGRMRSVIEAPGEPIEVDEGWTSLACVAHLSDLHVCDAQSPSRVEYLDRYGDPDSPLAAELGYVGVYRAQESLTVQVLASAVAATNAVEQGPSGAAIEAVVVTGDTVDNAQRNEMRWYLAMLDGGTATPTSGHQSRWEGAGAPDDRDERYWHPEGGTPDLPRAAHGFPTIPGFLGAAQRPVTSPGLAKPWFAVHGNHDAMLQGVTPPDDVVRALSTGNRRVTRLADHADARRLILEFAPIGPAVFPYVDGSPSTVVTPDAERAFLAPGEYAAAHLECGHGHGFTSANAAERTAYWQQPLNDDVLLVSLDTVNRHGGWHGCVDRVQLAWLRRTLEQADRYVVVLSHHPVETLVNDHSVDEPAPALADELTALLLEFPNVVLWLAGHTHKHEITYVGPDQDRGFWHIRTASLIDWPQQSRIVELLERDDDLAIATFVYDHVGTVQPDGARLDTRNLAGISRWLAANDWKRQSGVTALDLLEGAPHDRNVVLPLTGRRRQSATSRTSPSPTG